MHTDNRKMKPEELALRKKYEDLLKFGNEHPDTYQQTLTKLRQLILMEGFPKQTKVRPPPYFSLVSSHGARGIASSPL